MFSRSSPIILTLRLLWGAIPLAAAATIIFGLASSGCELPASLLGMLLGIAWLVVTYFAWTTRCRRCKKWFSGDAIIRLPANGFPESKPAYVTTYKCRFCGAIRIE